MIITIFNCGTRYDQDAKGELIAALYLQSRGERFITAGPGSATMSKADYDPFSDKRPKGWKNPLSIARDSADGGGMQYNVGCLVSYLQGLKTPPDVINMVGWSRGAVTCIMMANAIQRLGMGIVVNIFCIDPVPGPLNFGDDMVSVPACVKYCATIIMENGQSTGFTATRLHLADPRVTEAEIYTFPGTHGSCVEARPDVPAEPAYVIHGLAEIFLHMSGTLIEPTHVMTAVDLLELYGKIVIQTDKYMALSKDNGKRSLGNQSSSFIMNNHIQDHGYFVNNHHRAVFKMKYVHLLFDGDVRSLGWIETNRPTALKAYQDKLADIGRHYPKTADSLRVFHKFVAAYGS